MRQFAKLMPTIYDNIDKRLLDGLRDMLQDAVRADFCVGYFNLRGWGGISDHIEQLQGENGEYCRLLIGMSHKPEDAILRRAYSTQKEPRITQNQAYEMKQQQVENFAKQLTFGCPSATAERDLRTLSAQLRSRKVQVKLHTRYPLHAKLYLMRRADKVVAMTGVVGSSNLTLAGLQKNGELNVDVFDPDMTQKLSGWFEERWNDDWSIDINDELADIIDKSWAFGPVSPYEIYLKTIYHLSQAAMDSITQYPLPREFRNIILDFQARAVSISAHMLQNQGGVIIGDVVGLGKTLIASAVAKTFQDDQGDSVLVICPPKLEKMWDSYLQKYMIVGKTLSHAKAKELKNMRRYKLIIVDESHNFRNRDANRYQHLHDYIRENDSRVILLTATPYNKAFTDIASQLRLFVNHEVDLGIRPEIMLAKTGNTLAFNSKHTNTLISSLAAFELSEDIDDWRELMRRYMVRRTRGHIKEHYAEYDKEKGQHFFCFQNGERFYFPHREPRALSFPFGANREDDDYAKLYSQKVVDIIGELQLPRYGLKNYLAPDVKFQNKQDEQLIKNLTRAGPRLRGFTRSGMFKRLESSGNTFLTSVYRHIIRNAIFLAALENPQGALPIGQITSVETDEALDYEDKLLIGQITSMETDKTQDYEDELLYDDESDNPEAIYKIAAGIYNKRLRGDLRNKFKWIDCNYFNRVELRTALHADIKLLQSIHALVPSWNAKRDRKLKALYDLVQKTHGKEKILIFSQYKDTTNYLSSELRHLGVENLATVNGGSKEVMETVKKFSPQSNGAKPGMLGELRVLVATDTLSEGQNLQDAHIVVNYDLPWAIIRLIQRAGRVDRIGQKANTIYCYCAMPEKGIEKVISLRQRLKNRMQKNEELLGSDERFFEGEKTTDEKQLRDLYAGTAKLEEPDDETDLISRAYDLWRRAEKNNPTLAEKVRTMPDVVYSAKASSSKGVISYIKDGKGHDILAHIGDGGEILSQAQAHLLDILECDANTPATIPAENHHELVKTCVTRLAELSQTLQGGQLGGQRAVRHKLYHRLGKILQLAENTPLLPSRELKEVRQAVYDYPLTDRAQGRLRRLLMLEVSNDVLETAVLHLHEDNILCIIPAEGRDKEPSIICSMGLTK